MSDHIKGIPLHKWDGMCNCGHALDIEALRRTFRTIDCVNCGKVLFQLSEGEYLTIYDLSGLIKDSRRLERMCAHPEIKRREGMVLMRENVIAPFKWYSQIIGLTDMTHTGPRFGPFDTWREAHDAGIAYVDEPTDNTM